MANKKIALIGNPNTGKTTLFNKLSGLNQKTGNYAGVTVDKKVGYVQNILFGKVEIIDFPGTYSIYPSSYDEEIVLNTLINPEDKNYPDAIIVVADASNLKRNLLLFSQIQDLGIPSILALNMLKDAADKNISIDEKQLSESLGVPVFKINARSGDNTESLVQEALEASVSNSGYLPSAEFQSLCKTQSGKTKYTKWLKVSQNKQLSDLNLAEDMQVELSDLNLKEKKLQSKEIISRYQSINKILKKSVHSKETNATKFHSKIDQLLTHNFFGYLIFLGLLLFIFQAVYSWASIPMDFIDESFGNLAYFAKNNFPEGPLFDLISDAIIPGIGGVVIFIPQIAILFFFLALMEESGYMARVVYLMDKFMRKLGMSGRSVVPLISGLACAIPGIMAARSIENKKERFITIMVAPFMTCSARLPVYAILIALIIPEGNFLGFSLQGLALLGMYLLGVLAVFIGALALKYTMKSTRKSYLMLELPSYKVPLWSNILLTVFDKTKLFVFNAGKIILGVSIVLWLLGSFSFKEEFYQAEGIIHRDYPDLKQEEYSNKIAAFQLENSILGNIGKSIEPTISPMGYDWKMGIALISSIAAREVFVGSMATIYSLGSDAEEKGVLERLKTEINPKTGKKAFTFSVGVSLLLFYAFAMQCISTIAIVKRETKSWAWTLGQFSAMTIFAYLMAFLAYQILN